MMNIIAEQISKRGIAFMRKNQKFRIKYKRKYLMSNNLGVLGIDYPNEKRESVMIE